MGKKISTNDCVFNDLKPEEGIVYKILNSMKDDVFLSEADFHFSFAQRARAKDNGAEDVILLYPIMSSELYRKCEHKITAKENDKREYLDLRFKYGDDEYFIEFKYKLSDIYYEDKKDDYKIKRYPECEFVIKEQGASNNGRYYIYEDIQRMENIKKVRDCKSYVVFITNDSKYWRLNGDENKNKQPASYSGFCLGIKKVKINNNILLKYKIKDNVHKLFIEKPYPIMWYDFKKIEDEVKNGEFKLLVIDLQKSE